VAERSLLWAVICTYRRSAVPRCSLTNPCPWEVRATSALSFRRLAGHPELIDGALHDDALVREMLRDLRRVNRWLGGTALSRSALLRLLQHSGVPRDLTARARPLRILDVGTGAADIPVDLLRWGARQGISLEIEAIDSRSEIISAARRDLGAIPGLSLRVADALSLPDADGSFDVAHTSLLAHHLEPDALERALRELSRVSAVGVIVNDLDRTMLALAGAWLLTHVFTRNPLTRHDGPLSVRRAYRPSELRRIAASAGLVDVYLARGVVGYRYAMALVCTEAAASGAAHRANSTA
jgi:ubiquinone/menaquinone biosynthesis C-methylase UbiE